MQEQDILDKLDAIIAIIGEQYQCNQLEIQHWQQRHDVLKQALINVKTSLQEQLDPPINQS